MGILLYNDKIKCIKKYNVYKYITSFLYIPSLYYIGIRSNLISFGSTVQAILR